MKVCPVCQYEEEQDDEVACAICGSDLDSSEEVIDSTEDAKETSSMENLSEVKEESVEVNDSPSTTEDSMTDEEKLLEETLKASEISSSDEIKEEDESTLNNQLSEISRKIKDFVSRFDALFLTDGKINFLAPMLMFFVSILLFFAVVGLLLSNVPLTDEESTDGFTPTTPYSKNELYIGRGTSDPFSGDPFNCEIWDSMRYE